MFAAFAAVGFVAAYIGPTGVALIQANAEDAPPVIAVRELRSATCRRAAGRARADGAETAAVELDRGGYSVYVKPKPTPTPTPGRSPSPRQRNPRRRVGVRRSSTPDPGTAQAIAYEMVLARGWGDDQFACLVALWNKESGWRVNAYNASSGAYGIPQALPGSKMGSAGADWETNPATQITWGLGYITGRYGTPCGAWDHSIRVGWY